MGWMAALPFVKTGIGALSSLFGGGKSDEEKLAEQNLKAQTARSNQFWQQAQGQMGAAQSYYAPIAGGSREAAMTAMAPEVQGAAQRMDAGRKSLLNLSSRSGGAAAGVDPYAKGAAATDILQKARPAAAQGMADLSKTTGGWAANQGQAPASILDNERARKAEEAKRGAGFYDILSKGFDQFGEWFGNRKKSFKGSGSSGSW